MEKNLASGLSYGKAIRKPTFFLTLPCADLQWNELISIIFKLNRVDTSDEEVDEMSRICMLLFGF